MMGKKGCNHRAKALSVPKAVHINRKSNPWTIKVSPGAHPAELSVPLGIVIRDYLGLADTLGEAKKILSTGEVKVNGVIRKSHQFGAGLFDLVSLEKQKVFSRMLLDKKGRLFANILQKESKEKIARVENKTVTSKGIQLTTRDGQNFIGVEAKVGDSIKIALPEGKAAKVLPLKTGAQIYVLRGLHCAEIGTVKEIVSATQMKEKLIRFSKAGKEYETVARNVVVVGEKEVEIEDLRK